MNKTAIRNFATWARVTLQEAMRQRAGLLGITPSDIKEPLPASTPEIQYFDLGTGTPVSIEGPAIRVRKKLTERLLQDHDIDYGTAYRTLIENMASTWFNRLIAIRYMEVNDYFPDHIRTLSSDVSGKVDPDLVSTPFDSDLEFTTAEKQQILDWKDANQNDALFNFLLLKRCHQIGQWMPDFFEGDDDASDFFLQFSYIDPNGVVYHLVYDLPEDDFQDQVQIIGWLYQYYNSELKDEVFANLKKNVKVTKENIPAATQLFTPDWIVRYMVENSLGRLWLAGHPDDALQAKWKYYVPDAPQDASVTAELDTLNTEYAKLQPEDLSLIDCCSGSGHILAYAFDVLMDIYDSQGYTPREAAQSILEHNLYGLDIDDRAWQLTYFSLMMKARQYDRRLFSRDLRPQVCAIEESNGLTKWSDMRGQVEAEQMTLEEQFVNLADELIDTFHDAKNYGSLLQVASANYDGLLDYMQQLLDEGCNNLFLSGWLQEVAERMPKLIRQAKLLSRQYWACVTNPPYRGIGDVNPKLQAFSKNKYPDSFMDLSTMFMEVCVKMTKSHGFVSMINIPVWMSLFSYQKLRKKILERLNIINLLHLGRGLFGSDFGTTAFVLQKYRLRGYKAFYQRFFERKGSVESIEKKEQRFFEKKHIYNNQQELFNTFPNSIIAYGANKTFAQAFQSRNKINTLAKVFEGLKTRDKNRFVRFWFEVDDLNLWKPYAKGGNFRRWYGNNERVVKWGKNGDEIRAFKKSSGANFPYYFQPTITYTAMTMAPFTGRFIDNQIFGGGGGGITHSLELKYLLAFVNTKVFNFIIGFMKSTVNFEVGQIGSIPVIFSQDKKISIDSLTKTNVVLSKNDWDSFETSWDFQTHPMLAASALGMAGLLTASQPTLAERYEQFKDACADRFDILRDNEEELNRIFIDIYGLQDELTPDVAPKDVTVHQIFDSKDDVPADMQGSSYVLTKEDVAKSLLSYAMGCLFGRYSLDTPGLAYAGGDWDASKYTTFIPDDDNVVPITDEEYFDDDLPSFICAWLKKAFGRQHFEENLEFLTTALGTKGKTPKDKLRTYFLKQFYKDHCKTYQKRPIYWLFDSGKENGFKAFVYIHRWTKDTEGRVLLYLHKVQKKYETELRAIEMNLENLADKRRAAQLEKRKEHLQKQLAEVKDYDEMLDHMANEQLAMDLDDGVKVNYEKMQTDRDGVKYPILAKLK